MKLNRNLTCWALAGLLLVILAIELFTPRLLHRPAKATSVPAHQKAAPATPSPLLWPPSPFCPRLSPRTIRRET